MTSPLTVLERFWSKVARTGPDDCWPWLAVKSGHGNYGYFGMERDGRRTMWLAHRLAYEFCVGPIPAGAVVMHRCDHPDCVNPAHLCLGSRSDNQRDMIAKGRHGAATHPGLFRGEKNPRAKLTQAQANQIRLDYAAHPETLVTIGDRYNLGKVAISRLLREITYRSH